MFYFVTIPEVIDFDVMIDARVVPGINRFLACLVTRYRGVTVRFRIGTSADGKREITGRTELQSTTTSTIDHSASVGRR